MNSTIAHSTLHTLLVGDEVVQIVLLDECMTQHCKKNRVVLTELSYLSCN